jgi:hypothetical protein
LKTVALRDSRTGRWHLTEVGDGFDLWRVPVYHDPCVYIPDVHLRVPPLLPLDTITYRRTRDTLKVKMDGVERYLEVWELVS